MGDVSFRKKGRSTDAERIVGGGVGFGTVNLLCDRGSKLPQVNDMGGWAKRLTPTPLWAGGTGRFRCCVIASEHLSQIIIGILLFPPPPFIVSQMYALWLS